MKKLISAVTLAVFLAMTPMSFACEGEACFSKTYKNKAFSADQGDAWTSEYDKSVSLWGYGNDSAFARAEGLGQSSYSAYSGSKFGFNGAAGSENSGSDSMANSYAFDAGNSSYASGIAHQTSFGEAQAIAGGFGWDGVARTEVQSMVVGYVEQGNIATELGNGKTSAIAGNTSGAEYYGSDIDRHCDTGKLIWGSYSDTNLTGEAFTMGHSMVNVDPYGNHQSSYGKTGTISFTDVNGADNEGSHVWGTGAVVANAGVGSNSDGGYASGISGFNYDGSKLGFGSAEHTSYASKDSGCNTSSARSGSSGSAFSFVAGDDVRQSN